MLNVIEKSLMAGMAIATLVIAKDHGTGATAIAILLLAWVVRDCTNRAIRAFKPVTSSPATSSYHPEAEQVELMARRDGGGGEG